MHFFFFHFITGILCLISSGIGITDTLDCNDNNEVHVNIGKNVSDFYSILRMIGITNFY